MNQYPHTVESVARALGRFEMHTTPGRSVRGSLGLDIALQLGIATAASVHAFTDESAHPLREAVLAQFGRKRGKAWSLQAPDDSNRALWRRLLESDTLLVIEAPADADWVERCIDALHRPIVYHTGTPGLSEGTMAYCRRYLRRQEGLLLVSYPRHESISLFGRGPLFERALETSAHKSPDVWGYSDEQRTAMLRGALRLFKAKLL